MFTGSTVAARNMTASASMGINSVDMKVSGSVAVARYAASMTQWSIGLATIKAVSCITVNRNCGCGYLRVRDTVE